MSAQQDGEIKCGQSEKLISTNCNLCKNFYFETNKKKRKLCLCKSLSKEDRLTINITSKVFASVQRQYQAGRSDPVKRSFKSSMLPLAWGVNLKIIFLFGFFLKIKNIPLNQPKTINMKFRPVFEIGIQLVLGDITHLGTFMKTSNSASAK